jgi:hypothetical protein
MSPDAAVRCLFELWKSSIESSTRPTAVALLGAPGIGKTSTARALAAQMTAYQRSRGVKHPALCEVRDLSSSLPEDLGGLPFRDGNVTRYAPQTWMSALSAPDAYGVLVLDDLPAASASVQVASRQIALDHRVHDTVLSPGVLVLVTGNRREDKSAAATLPAHFRNSVVLLPVEPELESWLAWYTAQGLDSAVANFLAFRPVHFSRVPKDADARGAFATPRTWAMLGRMLPVGRRTDTLWDLAAGLVGEGVATEFAAFVKVMEDMVSPEAVLDDPERALPDVMATVGTPDRMIAMVSALAETTVVRARKTPGNAAFVAYLRALAWVTEKGGREYVATSISTFTRHKGDFAALRGAVAACRGDARVHAMLSALAACLKEA